MASKRRFDPSHARKRCKQRFGFKLSKRQYKNICDKIKGGQAELCLDGRVRSIWAVTCAGEILPVVYDAGYAAVVTVLPREILVCW